MNKKYILVSVFVFFLYGCSEEVKTVSYYKDPKNAEELDEKILYCKDSADRMRTTNCSNAMGAKAQLNLKKFLKG